ncbi:glycoside hydrolase family 3 N-terminal domain-containing protein [Oerskovia enterophila]|uniref:Beta-hexosaminidase n=1 Tax=Oerskovia enterophila TaxID=43678 RepID=A0ABX2Y0E6_9CELL|nr:glycoside hydrolase family 3 N-terminal domain-containing protein [Oerskovia enterophila]OCI29783.1 beta-hexosaminidase precursor [Oerskovia enterophila]
MTTVHHDALRAVNGVLLPGFTGTDAPAWLLSACEEGLAGVIYFAYNTPDVATTARLSASLHEAAPDLLIAIDEEGGDVSRLEAATGSSIPGAAALGVIDDVDLTERVGLALGRLLAATGVDLDLAPVLDVNSRTENPVVGVRAFGATPDLVSRHGAAFVQGLHRAGVGACGKHFPGHGATDVDSHLSLPVVDDPLETIRERDLPPFVRAFEPDVAIDSIMTAHLLVPAIGPRPVSLEPAAALVARELGFEGPIITDALDMGAVKGADGIGEVAVQAIEGGADLLCLGTTVGRDDEELFRQAQSALLAAVEQGRVTVERLLESAARTARTVRRVRELQASTGATCGPTEATAALEALAAVGQEAAERAVRTHGPLARLDPTGPAPDVIDLRQRFDHAAGRTAQHVQSALRATFPGTEVHVFSDPAGWEATLAAVSTARPAGDPVRPLVVITREPVPGSREAAMLDALRAARPGLVVVHTGFPDAVPAWFGDETTVVVACGTGRANARAAVGQLTVTAEVTR